MSYTELVEKFKATETGYTLSLFAQKEVVYALLALVIFLLIVALCA